MVLGTGQIDSGLGAAAYTVDTGQIDRVGQGADATFNRVLLMGILAGASAGYRAGREATLQTID